MNDNKIEGGTIHELTYGLQESLMKSNELQVIRNSLTPLARNERICYISIPKKEETKIKRLLRLQQDLKNGKKRPCCRPGCPHHRKSAKKWFT